MNPHRATPVSPPDLRDQIHRIAEQLPADATWEDVRYQVDLRASVERGLADIEAGRTLSVETLLAEFGIQE